MSNIAPTVARQALRIASRRYPSSTFSRVSSRAVAGQVSGRRSYVSETKPSKATVNVDTTIKAERKAFLEQTGEKAQDATMPTTGLGADAMMSPTAGKLRHRPPPVLDDADRPQAS
jgi:cysteine desulfurase